LFQQLTHYQELGLSFFALPYQSKIPDGKWEQYQKRLPTDAEIKSWCNGNKTNIAIIGGAISGNLVILDCDSTEKFKELAAIICKNIAGIDSIIDFTLVSKTAKGYHIFLRTKQPVKSKKYPKLDIKGEGGYVVAPPSVHPSGAVYRFVTDRPIVEITSLKTIGINIEEKKELPDRKQPDWVSQMLSVGVGEGARNDSATKLVGFFRDILTQEVTERIMLDWNTRNTPPLPDSEILNTIKSVYRKPKKERLTNGPTHPPLPQEEGYSLISEPFVSGRNNIVTENVTKRLSESIDEWVKDTSGWFSYDDIDREFGVTGTSLKSNRRMIVKRLKDAGKLESHPKNNKLFRYINVAVRLIDFKRFGNKVPIDIHYPFGIERYFNTYPRNIIALAGSADAGKTAWLLNFIQLNQDNHTIYYQSSEMGEVELASRLEKFEDMELEDWKFTAEDRSTEFADVIRPDCINIIDYMELTGEFYLVAEYLKQIHDKLNTGICLVALQKKRGAELGRGGDFALEKPRLYLTMDAGKMRIQKAKNWADPEINPNGLILEYKIVAGCKFYIVQDWFKPA